MDAKNYRNWLILNFGIGIETQFWNSGIWYRNWKPYLRVVWSNEWTTILYSSPFITRLASPLSLILLELPFIKCREETTSRSMVQVVVKLRYASYNFGHIKLCLWSSRTDWEKNLSFGSHSLIKEIQKFTYSKCKKVRVFFFKKKL